jgi:phosphate acetyltransferase
MDLLSVITEKANQKQSTIVICEGWDRRCIEAASEITKEGLAKVILLGSRQRIEQSAGNTDLSNVTILDPLTYEGKDDLIDLLVETRKHKGMTREVAAKMIGNMNYFGCLLALAGKADGVAGSAICPTGDLMRPALQLLRRPGMVVSEVGIIHDLKNDSFFFLSDVSLNIDPEAEQLATIGLNAAEAVRDLGIETESGIPFLFDQGQRRQPSPIRYYQGSGRYRQEN